MKSDYADLIAEIDEALALLNDIWVACAPRDRAKWRAKINHALDLRVQFMAKGDKE